MIPPDATLVRYVLGTLPAEETERLDELSIADGEVADRLRAVEHDLADAYARGELSADERARWEENYLSHESGRIDLRVARALADAESQHAGVEDRSAGSRDPAYTAPSNRRLWPYGLAAAAVVILAVAAAMVLTRTQRRVAPPDEAEQHPTTSPSAPSAASGPPRFVALTLAAPRRDLATTPTLTMSAGTDEARLTLRLEPSEFDRFNVDVRDASTNHIVWQTRHVVATRDTDGRSILITVPVAALRAGRCLVQLSSDAPRGEIIGEYSLRIVLE